jgi:hypothetical protein
MARYLSAASFSGINTAGRAYAVLNAGATKRLRVLRATIAMPVICTTAPSFQLLRQTAAGVTPGATTTPQALDENDAAAAASLLTGGFGTQPTLTTASPLDAAALPLTAGAAWVWSFFGRDYRDLHRLLSVRRISHVWPERALYRLRRIEHRLCSVHREPVPAAAVPIGGHRPASWGRSSCASDDLRLGQDR